MIIDRFATVVDGTVEPIDVRFSVEKTGSAQVDTNFAVGIASEALLHRGEMLAT